MCKRIARRLRELGLPDVLSYRAFLEMNDGEWEVLGRLCRVTISRFARDRDVFDALRKSVLPLLLSRLRGRGAVEFNCLSVGCASGEEPYTLSLICRLDLERRLRGLRSTIVATDYDRHLLARARRGCYEASSLVELPSWYRDAAFEPVGGEFCLKEEFREGVEFVENDVRDGLPAGRFHVILCRNVVFTYFDQGLQLEVASRLAAGLEPEGVLVIGKAETLPAPVPGIEALDERLGIYVGRDLD